MECSESALATSLQESPMAYLGLRRRLPDGAESDPPSVLSTSPAPGITLNSRGIPARKRKKNSLIYGTDDMVSLPVKSPKKKQMTSPFGRRKQDSPSKYPMARSLPASPAKRPKTALKNGKKSFSATKSRSEQKRSLHGRRQKTAIKFRNLPVRRKLLVDDEDDDEDDIFDNENHSDGGDSFQNDLSNLVRVFEPALSDDDIDEDEVDKPSGSKIVTPSKGRHQSGQSPSFKRSLAKRFGPAISGTNDTPECELTTPEKQSAANIGVALRNMLRLQKAQKWVCFEFFYSNLDKVLFEGENDFLVCLGESFPDLKTRRLSRVEWSKIRRMMGKPRRCSAAFFAEERAELMRKRQKIRLLQQRKQTDVTSFKDLPDDIPLQVTIGARVTARLRSPQDGLFTGSVDAYDTSNNTYRIRFDHGGLTYSIPDEEVQSVEEPEMMPLSSFTARPRPRVLPQVVTPFISPLRFGSAYSPQLANDPLLSGNTPRGKVMRMDGQVGGYPTKFLEQIVRLNKSLKQKKDCVNTLRYLNGEGERKKSFGELITEDFRRRYASTVIELSNINRDLNEHIKNIQDFTQQFAPEAGPTISLPNIIREGCQEDAYDIVSKNNSVDDKELVENPKVLALISSFTALMLQVKQLAEGERNSFELQALHDAMGELKSSLFSSNMSKFENNVEVHMQHIVSGLSRLGNLHAFMMSSQAPKSKELMLKTESV